MISRIRNLAIEIVVALGIVGIIVFLAARDPRESKVALRWLGLSGWTALAFGIPIVQLRAHWREWLLWLSIAVLLALHLTFYILILQRISLDMASVFVFLATIAETQVIFMVLKKTVRVGGVPRSQDLE